VGDHILQQYSVGGIFKKTMVRVLGTQTRILEFVETFFSGLMDFIAGRHSASNNRNHFQCDVPKISRVPESQCSDFSPIFYFPTLFRLTLVYVLASSPFSFVLLFLFSLYNHLVLRRRKWEVPGEASNLLYSSPIVAGWMLWTFGWRVWTGFSWLEIGNCGELLCTL
jgi:hypothetical protein